MIPERPDRLLALVSILLGVVVFATTLYGVHHFYSSVIFWDEWDGYLGFYRRVLDGGGWHPWWEQHVDHRIVTSRVLFLLDLRYFHGNHIILFAAQLVMLGALVFVVARSGSEESRPLAAGVGVALMFSWAQNEILRWGFETQVVAAVFFTVWSLYVFCQTERPPARRFFFAFLLALLAEFSMGSGIVAPLMLVGASVVLRRPGKETALALIISLVMAAVYFIGFKQPPGPQPEPIPGPHILGLAKFFFLAAGNPLSQIDTKPIVCMIVGAVTTITAAALCLRLWLARQVTDYRAFLICIMVFSIGCIALVTIGRSVGGLSQAILSRYTTAPLLLWFAFAMLAYDVLPLPRRTWAVGAVVVLAGWTAIGQRHVRDDNSYLFDRKLAILSDRIGLPQSNLLWQVYPQASPWRERFIVDTAFGIKHKIGIYGEQWMSEAGKVKFDPTRVVPGCTGHNEHATRGSDGILTVSGWLATDETQTLIVLTNDAGTTIGYGITGRARPDVAEKFGSGKLGGWQGFARAAAADVRAYSYQDGQFCKLD